MNARLNNLMAAYEEEKAFFAELQDKEEIKEVEENKVVIRNPFPQLGEDVKAFRRDVNVLRKERGMKLGKAIRRVLKDAPEWATHKLQRLWADHLSVEVSYAEADIEWAYKQVRSCMSTHASRVAEFYYSRGVGIVILRQGMDIVGRALIGPTGFRRTYGEFHYILDALFEAFGVWEAPHSVLDDTPHNLMRTKAGMEYFDVNEVVLECVSRDHVVIEVECREANVYGTCWDPRWGDPREWRYRAFQGARLMSCSVGEWLRAHPKERGLLNGRYAVYQLYYRHRFERFSEYYYVPRRRHYRAWREIGGSWTPYLD